MLISEKILGEISILIYQDKSTIPIIDTIEVNDFIFGRFDIILNKYYGAFENRMALYPLLLDFNNISDPTNIYVGMFINIPDFESYLNQIEFAIYDKIPGVNSTTNSNVINEMQLTAENDDTTLAVPKLGIKSKKASYNPKTGIIKF